MTTRLRILASVAILVLSVFLLSGATDGRAEEISPKLLQLRATRAAMARDLSEPIAKCVAREDTTNPAFHGCIDWHSAVHGTWALTAYTWATGDQRYRPLIDAILRPSLLAEERRHLANNPDFEMPYGRAWFLRLAIDHRRAFGTELLTPLADDVAASLIGYYKKQAPDPLSVAYQSATWALINLYDYGLSRGNSQIVEFVKEQVRQHYLTPNACPMQTVEVQAHEFMAVCTNWAWLVERVLPREEFKTWLEQFLPKRMALEPISNAASVHEVGLNFSRAWGLWNLYRGTDDPRFLTSYLQHFNETYTHPELWKGDYYTVAHWVPQFGMLALMVTYYDWAK